MTDPIAEFIRRSREIEGRATAKPWFTSKNGGVYDAPPGRHTRVIQPSAGLVDDKDLPQIVADDYFTAHARNTHRALLDALEKAVAQIDDDLKHFHGTYCGLEEFGDTSCCNGCISLRDSKKEIESLLAEAMKET